MEKYLERLMIYAANPINFNFNGVYMAEHQRIDYVKTIKYCRRILRYLYNTNVINDDYIDICIEHYNSISNSNPDSIKRWLLQHE